ncbi:MAG: ACT domain-containing protein [Oscillospiraceae bacterium]|nr:ACT domain-containing protein [Oscillospiraceae bacterium]
MGKNNFNKDIITNFASQGLTVLEMSKKLNASYQKISLFYLSCYNTNPDAFPIHLLIPKEQLKKELEQKKVAQICREYNLSVSIINRLLAIYDIPTKPTLKSILTKELLYKLFVEENMADTEIADKYKCSIITIKNLRKEYGISHESRRQNKCKPSIEYFHKLAIEIGFSNEQLIMLLGCNPFYLYRLKQEYIAQGGKMAEDIATNNCSSPYKELICKVMEAVEPAVLYEMLKDKSLAQVAEMYEIIPPAEKGITTFSAEWLQVVLKQMSLKQISKTYYISYAFIVSLKNENNIIIIPASEKVDAKRVKFLFIQCGWTKEQIAKDQNVTLYAIISFLNKNKITAKDRITLEEKLSAEDFYELYVNKNLTLRQIAKLYETSGTSIAKLGTKYVPLYPDMENQKSSGITEKELYELMKKNIYNSLSYPDD